MANSVENDLKQYCIDVAKRAAAASAELAVVSGEHKNEWLRACAKLLREHTSDILAANQRDIDAADEYGLSDAMIDRLTLSPQRIDSIACALEELCQLPEVIGQVIESSIRPNGLEVQKVRVPLGVVFFIYESRPNVTADAAGLCVKSGNAVILRGGKEAAYSSRAIVDLIAQAAVENNIPADAVQLVNTIDREAVGYFLKLNELIDVAIPRGGEGLIRRVSQEATMPVIKHFAGNCHVYIDADADMEMAESITVNSKCHRLGVCNAAESLVVHRDIAPSVLPILEKALQANNIELRATGEAMPFLKHATAATDEDLATEFLGPIISVIVVDSLEQAIEHINRYSSGHTEVIVTNNLSATKAFTARIDSSAVIVNASTRFNDGGEFGLGAEIGISTDKFHARGPCGLKELTSYKYIVYGQGQVRK